MELIIGCQQVKDSVMEMNARFSAYEAEKKEKNQLKDAHPTRASIGHAMGAMKYLKEPEHGLIYHTS